MKIGLAGPHSTGKSTLLAALSSQKKISNLELLPEITRSLKEQGFEINEQGTEETQIMIMNAHMNNLLCKDNFIVDRCLMDGYVYTQYLREHRKVSQALTRYARYLLDKYVSKYDIIFYLPVEFDLKEDGVRSANPSFREEVAQIFESLIPILRELNSANIITLSGSVDQRVAQVIAAIGGFNGK